MSRPSLAQSGEAARVARLPVESVALARVSCDLHREHGVAAHEGFGAVDGVDQPQVFGVGVAAPQFFAVVGVVGECGGQGVADDFFGRDVDLGNGRGIGLELYVELTAIGFADEGCGGIGGGAGNFEVWGVRHGSGARCGGRRIIADAPGAPRPPGGGRPEHSTGGPQGLPRRGSPCGLDRGTASGGAVTSRHVTPSPIPGAVGADGVALNAPCGSCP